MSAIGLDIGNENCVIAAVKQRGIDVLLNEESKRETPALVSFGERQRFLGSAGVASAMMNPRSTISQVKRLIGRTYSETSVQDDLRLFPFETSEGPEGGILIHLQYMGGRQTFTPVQILAMLFSHLKETAKKSVDTSVSDCVIGIPSYFTNLQRHLYLDAASIAGLKSLRLMHDCTATALSYGIYKTDFLNTNATHVVFVDIGHCDTQVAVVSFEPGHMKILSHASDSNLGGRDFDEVLFRHFATLFKDQYNIDVYSNKRASIRLRASCEKLKKILSANAEAPLNIECLMDEKDVKGFINRDEFERMSSNLLERVTAPCHDALVAAGLTVEKVHSVELVGSGSRIPAIFRVLSLFFKKEPSRKLNASECVALGCALQCAMLSPVFRVREYEVQDSLPFSIGFSSDEGLIKTLTNGVLFPRNHPIPSIKFLTLQRVSTFHLQAFHANQNELPPGTNPKISSFTIGPFQDPKKKEAKVKIKIHLNLHGVVNVESASLIEDTADDYVMRGNGDRNSETLEVEANDESLAAGNETGDGSFLQPKHSNGTSNKIIKRHDIPITKTVYGGMTEVELSEAIERESQLAQQDIRVEQAKDKRNSLESYVYETRSKILSRYQIFATDQEKEQISQTLLETEEWLYDEGDDETEYVYNEKWEQLKKLLDPIERRCEDEDERAQATHELLNHLIEYRASAASLSVNEKDEVLSECNKAEQWLQEMTEQQDSLPKNVDPILWSSDIKQKADVLDRMCKHITSSKASGHMNSDQRHNGEDKEVDEG